MNNTKQLTTLVRRSKQLDEPAVVEIYNLWKENIETMWSVDDFNKNYIQKYEYVATFHDGETGNLGGFVFSDPIIRNKRAKDGMKYTFIQQVAGYMRPQYHKTFNPMYGMMFKFLLKESICHPFTPIFIGWRSLSYKGYLMAINMIDAYPRYNAKTPPLEKSIMDDFGKDVGGDNYDSQSGICKVESTSIKDGVADITETQLQNPHIRFFQESNPDWKRGHMLCLVSRVTWRMLFRLIMKIMIKSIFRDK